MVSNPATRIRFGMQQLLIGNGATPEVFSAWCGITTLTKTTSVETEDVNIPDCTDPDASSWLGIDEISRRITLTFGGMLTQEAFGDWREWDLAGGLRNVRWYSNLSAANGGGYLWGPAMFTAFEETAEAKRSFNMSGTIIFDGKPTWVALT